jgi:ubiquinone/menaquinone biosynthesis C-methylase UbiE
VDTGGPRHLYRERLIIEMLLTRLERGRVLDAGCGTGTLAMELARHGFQVNGMDLSRKSVQLANEKVNSAALIDQIRIIGGSITSIPFSSGSFDGVVCGEVLEHVVDDSAAVRELYRILRPDGICVVTVPANSKLWGFDDEWAGHLRRYEEEELIDLLERNGIHAEEVRWWGFPTLRLYRHMVNRLWVDRIADKTKAAQQDSLMTKVGVSAKTSRLFASVFRIDELFDQQSRGIGLLVGGRKTG